MTAPARIQQKCVRNPVFGTKTHAAYMYSRLMTSKTGLMTSKNAELFSDSNAAGGG